MLLGGQKMVKKNGFQPFYLYYRHISGKKNSRNPRVYAEKGKNFFENMGY